MLGRGNDKVPVVRRPWGGRTRQVEKPKVFYITEMGS